MHPQRPFYRTLVIMAFVLAISGAAPLAAQTEPRAENLCSDEILSSFDYSADLPLDIEEIGIEDEDGITIYDITFALDEERRVEAYLVEPPGDGPFAGVLFVHWLGHVSSNRDEFLPDAIELAKQGTVSLLVNAMWSEPGWFSRRKLEDDYRFSIQQVIDLRRALDLLLSQANIDSDRIGYVGHDFGAMFGAILAGVDGRPRVYVFMAGTDDFNNWYQLNRSRFPEGYEAQIATLAPTCFIGRAADVPALFQFAENDRYVPQENAQRFFDAANDPKEMVVYDTGHGFEGSEDAITDRLNWLVEHLELAPGE